ncbi:MAG: hypothetical protein HYZ14_07485 [Bacteroidetes bacterium]|nr:hypothetical protein [Bacteroidota bacterium]
MDRPRIIVDFNELIEDDLILLSQRDYKVDSSGESIELFEGKQVYIYESDEDINGDPGFLVADGIVEKYNMINRPSPCKWTCRIDSNGIRRIVL